MLLNRHPKPAHKVWRHNSTTTTGHLLQHQGKSGVTNQLLRANKNRDGGELRKKLNILSAYGRVILQTVPSLTDQLNASVFWYSHTALVLSLSTKDTKQFATRSTALFPSCPELHTAPSFTLCSHSMAKFPNWTCLCKASPPDHHCLTMQLWSSSSLAALILPRCQSCQMTDQSLYL